MRFFGRILWLSVFGVCLLLIASFVSVNKQSANLGLWPFAETVSAEIWLVVLVSLCAGLLTGGLVLWFASFPLYAQNRKLSKKLAKAEAEVDALSEQLAESLIYSEDLPKQTERNVQSLQARP